MGNEKLAELKKLMKDMLYMEAAELATAYLDNLVPNEDSELAIYSWNALLKAWENLDEMDKYDEAFARYIENRFADDFIFIIGATLCPQAYSEGYLIDNVKKRGHNYETHNAEHINLEEYDRSRILALYASYINRAEAFPDAAVRGSFFCKLADILLINRRKEYAHLLLELTDLEELPPIDLGYSSSAKSGAMPLDADGLPLFHSVPSSFQAAANDGERMRYAIDKAIEAGNRDAMELYADFLCEQFDFSQLENYHIRKDYLNTPDKREILYALKDNESIVMLPSGMRKIVLPPGSVYIELYRKAGYLRKCGDIYAKRLQFEKALEMYRLCQDAERSERILAIQSDVDKPPAFYQRQDIAVNYHFRNFDKVRVRLHKIDTPSLRRTYPKLLEKDTINHPVRDFAHFNLSKKIWATFVAETPDFTFDFDLQKQAHHWEGMQRLEFPPLPGNAYLAFFTPVLPNGKECNKSTIKTVICQTEILLSFGTTPKGIRIFANAPDTGKPIPHLELDVAWLNKKIILFISQHILRQTTLVTDEQGSAVLELAEDDRIENLLVAASGPKGYISWLYYRYFIGKDDFEECEEKVYLIPDRPIYHPGDTLSIAAYVRNVNGKPTNFSRKAVLCGVKERYGKEILRKEVPYDEERQCFTFEMTVPEDAILGVWDFAAVFNKKIYETSLLVEEFKKAEYNLSIEDASDAQQPRAAFQAEYYFGKPLQDGKINYTIEMQQAKRQEPFSYKWDWLCKYPWTLCGTVFYNSEYDDNWHGEEHIYKGKIATDEKGRAEIDLPKSPEGNGTVKYHVKAEISDMTGRVVTAEKNILHSGNTFKVALLGTCGYALPGESLEMQVAATYGNGQKVAGKGTLSIYRKLHDGTRKKDPVQTIPFDTLEGHVSFALDEAGMFELEAVVESEGRIASSQPWPLVIFAKEAASTLHSAGELELYTDKREYAPGQIARILLLLPKKGLTVYFYKNTESKQVSFQCLNAEESYIILETEISDKDFPFTFIRVESIWDSECYTAEQRLLVPPEEKLLDVSVELPQKSQPGETVPMKVKILDAKGLPPKDALVTIAVYDKALEYLARQMNGIIPLHQYFLNSRKDSKGERRCDEATCRVSIVSNDYLETMSPEDYIHIHFSSDFESNRYHCPSSPCGMVKCSPIDNAPEEHPKTEKMAAEDAEDEDLPQFSGNIRSTFLDRAFWLPFGLVPEDGILSLPVVLPDNLTSWRVRAWVLTQDTKVGETTAEILASKNLIARLELPRFMLEGDTVQAVVNLHNYTDQEAQAKVCLISDRLLPKPYAKKVNIPVEGISSFPVTLHAQEASDCKVALYAEAEEASDALELNMRVHQKGFSKQVNCGGTLNAAKPKSVHTFELPAARRKGTTAFVLNGSPSILRRIIELLPYLVTDDSDVFSITNRVVPATSAEMLLKKAGIELGKIDLHKGNKHNLYMDYMKQYTWQTQIEPTFDLKEIAKKAKHWQEKLLDCANSDGGWGWFPESQSDCDSTAYIVDAMLNICEHDNLKKSIRWLEKHAEKRLEDAKCKAGTIELDSVLARVLEKAGCGNDKLRDACYEHRTNFSPYGIASLALCFPTASDEAAMLCRMLEQYLQVNEENDTAYLKIPDHYCYFWYGDREETLALYLLLLLRNNAKDDLCRKVANYLATSLGNSPWRNSPRALASGISALIEYANATGEATSDFTLNITAGACSRQIHYDKKNIWSEPEQILFLSEEETDEEKLNISLELSGKGYFFWNGMLNYFSLEDEVKPEGLELKIKRNYYRIIPTEYNKRGGNVFKRIPLLQNDTVQPGELLEVELVAEAQNDYDYVVLEDAMPAGFEYDNAHSGWIWNWRFPLYAEYRERGPKFYLRFMGHGQVSISYRIRPQLAGTVTALPSLGYGIYAPALKCNGNSRKIQTNTEQADL